MGTVATEDNAMKAWRMRHDAIEREAILKESAKAAEQCAWSERVASEGERRT